MALIILGHHWCLVILDQHHLAYCLGLVTMDLHLGFWLAPVIWDHHHLVSQVTLVIMAQHHLAPLLDLVTMDHLPALLLAPLVIWDHYHLTCPLVCHLAP